jgi:hypothetical protein
MVDQVSNLENIDGILAIVHHATFGLSKIVGHGKEVSLAVTHAFSNTVTGPNPLEAPGRQQIGLEMNQWDFQIGYAFRIGR